MTRKPYPTDLTDDQWEQIDPLLPWHRSGTPPRAPAGGRHPQRQDHDQRGGRGLPPGALGPTRQHADGGGGGTNTLDYTAYPGDLLVNLYPGSATGVAGGALGKVFSVGNLTGGPGNDILVGNGGPDAINGLILLNSMTVVSDCFVDTLTGGTSGLADTDWFRVDSSDT